MPTYEYACRKCGEHLEVVQSFTDDPLTECPTCAGELRKVFSPIGISFKGSGFYRTDSRGSTSSAPAKKDSDTGSSTSTGSTGSTTSTKGSDSSSSSSSSSSSGEKSAAAS